MSAIIWTKDLATGIGDIDKQHMRIIDYLNMLESLEKNADAAKMEELLDGMLNFCVTCFSLEEDLMEQAGYKFLKAHKMMHETCMRRFSDIRARALNNEDVIPELRKLLKGYLTDHVQVQDKDYVEAVKKILKDDKDSNADADLKDFDIDGFMARHKGMV